MKNFKNIRYFALALLGLLVLNIFSYFFFFRLDLTSEKRYSLSAGTKELMKSLDKPIEVKIYLDGDLNPGFLRLKKATTELLDEFKAYNSNISYSYINPSEASTSKEREENYARLAARGLQGIPVNEKDEEGKLTQKIVFPWAEIMYGKDTMVVNLLKNIQGHSGDENLNISIENLEFELTDALRVQVLKTKPKIAFLEGHGELAEVLVADAISSFKRYYDVRIGQIGNDPAILKDFKAIIIANPQKPFTEQEKFIIDQYIMNGGRVMWLLDGVRIAYDSLSTMGISPAIPLNLNLDDQLFKYGVRIAPVLLQDMQSAYVPIDVSQGNGSPQFEMMPFYYSPLLLTSQASPITRNISQVKAEFSSGIELVGENYKIKKELLLETSNASHVQITPGMVDLASMETIDPKTYFNIGYIPVAVAMEGVFPSVFIHRMTPPGILGDGSIKQESKKTRMIVIADGDLIRNDVQGTGANMQILPLGYDKYMQKQFGNRSFILNSLLYLTGDDQWLALRSREFTLRMLNKRAATEGKKVWQIVNTVVPLVVLLLFMVAYGFFRKRKYTR